MIHFSMMHKKTHSATGYFRPVPQPEPSLPDLLLLCTAHPEDVFLRSFLLEKILDEEANKQSRISTSDFFLYALKEARKAAGIPDSPETSAAEGQSPLAYMRIPMDPEKHRWIQILHKNIFNLHIPEHKEIQELHKTLLTGPKLPEMPVPIEKIPILSIPCPPLPSPMDVFYAAMERMNDQNIPIGSEKRHKASLSPIALLREWDLDREVSVPGYTHRLTGTQTSYGRGLSLEQARVACLMEAAERITAFGGVHSGEISLRLRKTPIQKASLSELKKKGIAALNPNTLLLEAPMPDTALWWMPGERITSSGTENCLVPVQCVLLFANLPESQLFTALGSTGLAAGASEEGARLAALLEVLERDAEATMPHTPKNCFRIHSSTPEVHALLQCYEQESIYPFFEDITTEFGIPAYRCLVVGKGGEVIRGTGAHLCGKKALLSALTETPWPLPGPPSQKPDSRMPLRNLENLPDFSTDNPAADLKRIEHCLLANGYSPIHVPLTRTDLRIPVVRSIIPGLEILGDFDRFSTINQRLFTRYQHLFNKNT